MNTFMEQNGAAIAYANNCTVNDVEQRSNGNWGAEEWRKPELTENAQNALCTTPGDWFPLKQGTEIQSDDGLHEIAANVMVDGHEVLVNLAQALNGQHGMMQPDGNGGSREYASYTITPEEAYANACMMAAAPKLLEAVKSMLVCIGDNPKFWAEEKNAVAALKNAGVTNFGKWIAGADRNVSSA